VGNEDIVAADGGMPGRPTQVQWVAEKHAAQASRTWATRGASMTEATPGAKKTHAQASRVSSTQAVGRPDEPAAARAAWAVRSERVPWTVKVEGRQGTSSPWHARILGHAHAWTERCEMPAHQCCPGAAQEELRDKFLHHD
jgi:hypothetical protein